MNETRRKARVAGVLYLIGSFIVPVGLVYAPGKLIVSGNATATADNIRTSEWLLRVGIASELVSQIVFVFLTLALYRLFKAVNETHARLLVVFGALLSVPIVFMNVLNELAALTLVSDAGFLAVFDRPRLDALAYLFIRLHGQGITVVSIFWGLWLFPFGLLVIRSGFIPRFLGALLIVAGSSYLATALATLTVPHYAPLISRIALPLNFAELPIIFWLLIWGAKPRSAATGGSDRAST